MYCFMRVNVLPRMPLGLFPEDNVGDFPMFVLNHIFLSDSLQAQEDSCLLISTKILTTVFMMAVMWTLKYRNHLFYHTHVVKCF